MGASLREQFYELLKIWTHDEKKYRELLIYIEPILRKAESGKYDLAAIKTGDEKERKELLKKTTHAICFALSKPDQKVLLVSAKNTAEKPEHDIPRSGSFWLAVEKKFGPDPWQGYDDALIAPPAPDISPPWPALGRALRASVQKSFRPGLHDLLSDNIWNTAYYFLAYALWGDTQKMARLKPMLKIMAEVPPLGLKKYTEDTWYFLIR